MHMYNPLLLAGTGIKVAQLFAALSLLILLHEGGHFFFARLFKTRVEKFYLFFDFLFPFSTVLPFSLFKKKVGDTTYGIGWFPLGGYVKIAGMVDESMDKEQLAKPPEPWEYRSKKPWQRLFIMLGGIIVNVLVAIFIYSMIMLAYGEKRLPVSEMRDGIVITDSIGYKLGFADGDRILAVNGKPVRYYDEIMGELIYAKTVDIDRKGSRQTIQIPINFAEQLIDNKSRQIFTYPIPTVVGAVQPKSGADKGGLKTNDRIIAVNGEMTPYFENLRRSLMAQKGKMVDVTVVRDHQFQQKQVQVSDTGTIGFALADLDFKRLEELQVYKFDVKHYNFFTAFPAGASYAWERLTGYARQFKLIFNPKTGAYKGLGGFASMTQIFPDYWDWEIFWRITALISLILAFMNLLPIPGLDGGYVLFLLVEIVTRRKVNERVMEVATTIGLILLLALMVYANGMDVFRFLKH